MIHQLQAPTAARERALFPARPSVGAALPIVARLGMHCLTKRLLSRTRSPGTKTAPNTQALQIDPSVPPELFTGWQLRP